MGILNEHCGFVRHLDIQLNVLMGINVASMMFAGALAAFNLPKTFLLLIIFPTISFGLTLLSLHPPRSMRKKSDRTNRLINNNYIASFSTTAEYSHQMKEIFSKSDKLFEELTIEIYTIINFYYRPKRLLFRWSLITFMIGLGVAAAAFMIYFSLK